MTEHLYYVTPCIGGFCMSQQRTESVKETGPFTQERAREEIARRKAESLDRAIPKEVAGEVFEWFYDRD